MELVDVPSPEPGPGQVVVELAAAGVNYRDLNHRKGARGGALPLYPGSEGAGRVRTVGEGATEFAVGDRVAWKNAPASYAEQVVVDVAEAVPVPARVADEDAAAIMLQGLTAHYLATSLFPLRPGDTVLVHAAAGGVGLLLTQMLTSRGARVLGTVSSPEKARLARDAGATDIIRYDKVEFAEVVRELTNGQGVALIYDGIGSSTFDGSLASLRPRGCLALYGLASGPVPPLDLDRLDQDSLCVTRPNLSSFTSTREELRRRAVDLFDWLATGTLQVHVGGRYALQEARRAHADLEARSTAGKLLLLPT